MAIFIVGPTSQFPTIAAAMLDPAVGAGDTIQLEAGYSNETATVTHNNMTISGGASSTGIVLQLDLGIPTVFLAGTAPINLLDAADGNGIVGNEGNNVITVTGGADAVNGGLGTDRLVVDYQLTAGAVTGDSTTNFTDAGGSGSVTITNGTFEDFTILTGSGADTLTVGDGANIISAGSGANTVTAGNGVNSITGGADADTITAGNGGNFIDGGDGTNTLTSGSGSDVILSGINADTIVAGGGDDVITVRGGADSVDSGAENDRLVVDYSAMTTAVTGGVTSGNLGAGYSGHVADVTVNTVDFVATENFTITTGSGNDDITTGDGIDVLTGRAGNDQLNGGGGVDTLEGGLDDDTLIGGTGADTLDGGDGTDVADYSASAAGVTVNLILGLGAGGDAQGDTLGNIENIVGSAHADLLTGVDSVANVLDGGDGDDLLFFDALDTLIGGSGNDAAFVTTPFTSGAINIDMAASSLETVWASHFNDTVDASGTTTGVTIVGLGGADTMIGGSGNDTFYTDTLDTVVGGAGFDTVFGSGGGAININIATAQVENVWGSDNADNLDGSGVGAGTNITLVGFAGADQLRGGAGDDFVYFDHEDTVVEGGAGNDWAVASSGSSAVTVDLAAQGFENAWGSLSGDTISAAGLATAATIVGDAGDDIITGGQGADWLYGFDDNDTLDGGGGNDNLVGGAGTDTFAFGVNWGVDTVWDWQDGQEQFDLSSSGATQFSDLTVTTVGSDAVVSYAGNQFWVLNAAGQVGAGDFLF